MPDRRKPHGPDRRAAAGMGGRRATDHSIPLRPLAEAIGMSADFLLKEIAAGELKASQFGREWRVPTLEACRYLDAKGWPLPRWLDCFRFHEAAEPAARSARPARPAADAKSA
jgi:hypothetical protein